MTRADQRIVCRTCGKDYPSHDMHESGDCKWCEPIKRLQVYEAFRSKAEANRKSEQEAWILRNHAEYMRAALQDIARGIDGKPLTAKEAQQRARRCFKAIGLEWKSYDKPKSCEP